MGSTVDGLVSGLDTTALISQLMQIEATSQNTLKTRLTTQKSIQSAYLAINTRLAAVQTAAESLIPTAFTSAWTAVRAASTSATVAATASSGATSGSVSFDVVKLARANTIAANYAAPTDAALAGGFTKVAVTIGAAAPVDVTVTTNTPQGVADAINAAGLGVRAGVVTTDQGTMLQFSATKTGTAAAVSVANLAVPVSTLVSASDAMIQVGDPGDAGDADGDGITTGYSVTSGSNTFTGLATGLSVTVGKVESGVTVTMTSNGESVADKVSSMVDAVNSLLTDVAKYTAYNAETKTASLLTGNFLLRNIGDRALGAVSAGAGAGLGSLKAYGVQLTKDGKLTFDRAAFTAAYAADPVKTQSAIAGTLSTTLKDRSVADQKNVSGVIQNGDSLVRDLTDRISSWDIRLALRKTALQKQFTGLETALSKLNQQSSWLAGQINSLPKWE